MEIAESADERFLKEMRRRVDPILAGAGIEPACIAFDLRWHGPDLTLYVCGPIAIPAVRQAIGLYALVAVSRLDRTIGDLSLQFV